MKVVALEPKKSGRKFGAYKDELPHFPASFFFDPLPDDELALWEGEGHEQDRMRLSEARVKDGAAS